MFLLLLVAVIHNSPILAGLSTLKVQNMLDDYGESTTDRYPSRRAGLPLHKQSRYCLAHRSSVVL